MKALISGHIGDFDVFAFEDVITVIDEKKIVQKRKVKGLNKFLSEQQGRVRLTLGQTEDFNIIGLWDKEGFGYALNLEAPELSEWGFGGRDLRSSGNGEE